MQLPDLSVLSTPYFNSTSPLPRPLSASGAFRRSSLAKRNRLASTSRRHKTRSISSSPGHSSDGSLGGFSMENYTIDIAQLGKKEGAARPVGFEQAFQSRREEHDSLPNRQESDDEENEGEEKDLMHGYEIDLGGLGDKPSSVVMEEVVRDRDEIPTEDEGPEDFTQNLEAWMRGEQKWKRQQEEEIAEGHQPDPDPEQDLQQVMATSGVAEESIFEPLGTSTPAPLRNHAVIEKGLEEEARMQAPPLTRLNTETLQNQAAEEVFDRISALQAEVENMRMEDEARRANHQALEQEHKKLREEYETAKHDHQSEYGALEDEYDQWKLSISGAKDSLVRENKDLTREYNAAVEQVRVLEKQSLQRQQMGDASLQTKHEEQIEELKAVNAAAEAERIAVQSEAQTLRQELKASKYETNAQEAQFNSIQDTHRSKVNELLVELEARTKEVALERKESIDRANEATSLTEGIAQKDAELHGLSSELKAMQKKLDLNLVQLAETRRIVENVEDENDRLMQQNEQQAQDILNLKACIKSKETQEPTVTPTKNIQTDTIDQSTHTAALEALRQQHQTTLSGLGADHGKEIQVLRDALLKAGEGMQKREKKITKAHEDQIISLNQQIATLKKQQPKISEAPETTAIEKELRSAIRALNTKLEQANALISSARAEAEEARQQAEDAQRTNAIVNEELETRFAETIETREREWRRRVALLFKERDKMGKALMWGWGREEVGAKGVRDGEQGYRYMFAKRG